MAGDGELPSVDRLKESLKGQVFGRDVSLEVVPERLTTFKTE